MVHAGKLQAASSTFHFVLSRTRPIDRSRGTPQAALQRAMSEGPLSVAKGDDADLRRAGATVLSKNSPTSKSSGVELSRKWFSFPIEVRAPTISPARLVKVKNVNHQQSAALGDQKGSGSKVPLHCRLEQWIVMRRTKPDIRRIESTETYAVIGAPRFAVIRQQELAPADRKKRISTGSKNVPRISESQHIRIDSFNWPWNR